jgi:hypothetical protein
MVTASSKPKRSMRVATIFTGIAACTTAGMAHGAAAQAAATKAASRVSGNIQERTCEGVNTTWLHVLSEASHRCFSFGFDGTSIPTNEIGLLAQCGGNNYGWFLSLRNQNSITFGRGTTYRYLDWPHLSYVHISGWGGNDTCPWRS